MALFTASEPLFRAKQTELDVQDLEGLLRLRWKIGNLALLDTHYTRVDQACMLWGLVAAIMFVTAQFFSIPWTTQALLWSALTLFVTTVMVSLTWFWATVEKLRWLILTWVSLIALGLAVTDYSIFTHWGWMMGHLCTLWLGISAMGYLVSGLGLQSRSLLLIGIIHILSCYGLNYVSGWQFLVTGLVMAISLTLLGEYQWDMRLTLEFEALTTEEQQFNAQQRRLRQMP